MDINEAACGKYIIDSWEASNRDRNSVSAAVLPTVDADTTQNK